MRPRLRGRDVKNFTSTSISRFFHSLFEPPISLGWATPVNILGPDPETNYGRGGTGTTFCACGTTFSALGAASSACVSGGGKGSMSIALNSVAPAYSV